MPKNSIFTPFLRQVNHRKNALRQFLLTKKGFA